MHYKNLFIVTLYAFSMSLWAQQTIDAKENKDDKTQIELATQSSKQPLFSIKTDPDVKGEASSDEVAGIKVVKVIDFTQDPPQRIDLTQNNKAISTSRSLKRATSYTVRGKTYRTLAESEGFVQEGSASWYGPGFHGRKTASGEIFNMNDFTAAHKELPLGTEVEVTNLSTGKSIVVRINDRGPFHGNRVLDLSRAAAQELGVVKRGTAEVSIRALQ